MKNLIIFLIPLIILSFNLNGQTKKDSIEIDYLIISGSFGVGGVISTNIINSGGVIPTSIDFMGQIKHMRWGLGYTHELYLTLENLGKFVLGESSNTDKVYLIHEGTVFRHSPINLGYSLQFGGFTIGDEMYQDEVNEEKTRLFGNLGAIVEVGAPKFYLFVRPALEYKSYGIGSFHKEILATVSVGLRWKFESEE